MQIFQLSELKKLYIPKINSMGEQNGQVTIIGGSDLFHGAPIFALKVASRIVDMVFFGTPEKSVGMIAESIKSKLMSFIWVPWDEAEKYIEKSDAVLIGNGMKRFNKEAGNRKLEISNNHLDSDGQLTRDITERLLKKFPHKKWVIDAGSLQVMEPEWIPRGAVLTPNKREFEILFGLKYQNSNIQAMSRKHSCVIVAKGPDAYVFSGEDSIEIKGGNAGLTKGGTGDVLAGLTVALLAKNSPFLAAAAGSYIVKKAAEDLYSNVGTFYNSDDLAEKIPDTLHQLLETT